MVMVKAGTTSWRGYRVRIFDPATGLPYTGATSATAGAAAGYTRTGSTRTTITLSDLAAVDSAFSAGGMKHIGGGEYRLDIADAGIATGVDEVTVDLSFTAYTAICQPIRLVGYDPRTELTTAALAHLDTDVSSRLAPTTAGRTLDVTATGEAGVDWANIGSPTTTVTLSGTTVKAVTDAGADTAGTTTLLSRITALLQTKAEADTAHGLLATAADLATLTGYVDTEVAAIKAKTDNLPSDPADQSQVEAAITAAQSALAAAIAALNNLSSAQAQTAAAAALAAYDGPTNAEMLVAFADLQTHGDDEWSGGGATPETFWTYPDRSLSVPVAPSTDGTRAGLITRTRGDTWTIQRTGLGDISARTVLWFSIKKDPDDADADAVLTGLESGGLVVLNGSEDVTAGDFALTVDDENDGDITIIVAAAASAQVQTERRGQPRRYFYDCQMLSPAGVTTLESGQFVVNADVTRAIAA